MHTTRLFRLLYLLLEHDGMTAARLAHSLEVSVRTVYRDIEALSAAGIPVYCARGKGGGVRLMPGFAVSRAMLTGAEQREVLAALQGLGATGEPQAAAALSKLAALFRQAGRATEPSWVAVDFADWGQVNAALFDTLKGAVLEKRVIRFRYFGTGGQATQRTAEPLQLWFKHRAWYLRAWCRRRDAPRLFKLPRIRGLEVLDETFGRVFDPADFYEPPAGPPPAPVELVLHIDGQAAHRVWDEFAEEDVHPLPEGSFEVRARFIMEEWVLGYILSFGPAARVVSPAWVGREVARRLAAMAQHYPPPD